MGTIKEHINQQKKESSRIQRLRYFPYKIETAFYHWMQIAQNVAGKKITLTPTLEDTWKNIIRYAHGDEYSKYDINKYLFIAGGTGSGKTMTMKILNEYLKIDEVKFYRDKKLLPFNFRIVNARDLINAYSLNGYDGIEQYLSYSFICIDDLGTEQREANYYGTKLDVISEIIEIRYEKFLSTHFTSNLDMNDILEKYDNRVHSRINHTCNYIIMNEQDFRL